MTMGTTPGARNKDPKVSSSLPTAVPQNSLRPQECQTILDVFFDLGHRELDTARVYCGGTTEEVGILCVLGSWKKLGILEGRYGRLRAFIWSKRLSLTRSDEASPSPYAE